MDAWRRRLLVKCEADLLGNLSSLKPYQSDVVWIVITVLASELKWNNFDSETWPTEEEIFLLEVIFPGTFVTKGHVIQGPEYLRDLFSLRRNIVTRDQCNRMETEWANGQSVYFKQRVSASCPVVTNICWDPFFEVWKGSVTSSFHSFTIWFLMPSNAMSLNNRSC